MRPLQTAIYSTTSSTWRKPLYDPRCGAGTPYRPAIAGTSILDRVSEKQPISVKSYGLTGNFPRRHIRSGLLNFQPSGCDLRDPWIHYAAALAHPLGRPSVVVLLVKTSA